MINIPELLLELVLPPTELTGAGALLELLEVLVLVGLALVAG
ncbi:MAG: hypothetical protein E7K65_09600 [Pseudomonas sp.]|nr:hypothetical protein [Pseudomonas sp.]